MKKKPSLYVVGTNGLGVNYGGWDNLLSNIISEFGKDYEIYVYTSKFEDISNAYNVKHAKPLILPIKANGYQSVFYDFYSMLHASLNGANIILVLGLSGGIFFPFFKFFKSLVILNPDGAEWKRSKWNFLVKKYLKLSEYFGIKFSDCVVSDNKVIKDEIFQRYKVHSHLAEYGGDHVKRVNLSTSTAQKYNINKYDYSFKVCRIVPENNLDIILDAFSCSNRKFILVGNWNNSEYGIKLKKKYESFKNLILLDPIYEQAILDELRGNCRLYIHGHSVGGTNPSLVEAMNLGLCCVVFDVNYNRETTNNKSIYFKNKDELIKILDSIYNDVDQIKTIEKNMLEISGQRFQWKIIMNSYRAIFETYKVE